MVYESDAILVMADGEITQFGPANTILETLPADTPITHYRDSIITAGFIDSHVHYPQTQSIGAFGKQLIDWLENMELDWLCKPGAKPEQQKELDERFQRVLRAE